MCIQLKPPFSRHKGIGVQFTDEPTGNLDTENSELIFPLFQRLAHEEGYCVIVVPHDLDIADKADEVLRLKDGALLA